MLMALVTQRTPPGLQLLMDCGCRHGAFSGPFTLYLFPTLEAAFIWPPFPVTTRDL